jgi:hypothetical protein
MFKKPRAGIFKKSMGARHRGGIGFSYRPARLHRLVEFIPWHQFRGPIHISKYGLSNRFQGIDSVSLCSLAGRYVKYVEPEFVNLLKSPGIDSQPDGLVRQLYWTYWPARLHRLAESIPGLPKRYKFGLWVVVPVR